MEWTLVTGGAKRLGAEICDALAREGHHVIVHYLSSEKEADAVVQRCQLHGVRAIKVRGDFSNPSGVNAFLAALPRDIVHLINNVGNFLAKSPAETLAEEWGDLMQVNFLAPVAIAKELLPDIMDHCGTITNIGTAGINDLRADAKYAAYTASKRALLHWTKSLARELASAGVRVNMVSPGELDNSVNLKDPKALPMGRAGRLPEVADTLAFLVSARASYITGQNIEVAGGYCL